MLEIRDKEHPPCSTTIAADSEGPKVTPEASGNPVEAIEQRYASKSTIRYKNRSKSSNSCPLAQTRNLKLRSPRLHRCSFLLSGLQLDYISPFSMRNIAHGLYFRTETFENPSEQRSSHYFLHGENHDKLVRTRPISPNFIQGITIGHVKLRFSGIYKILSELGGVGHTKHHRSNLRFCDSKTVR